MYLSEPCTRDLRLRPPQVGQAVQRRVPLREFARDGVRIAVRDVQLRLAVAHEDNVQGEVFHSF
jgi:hypothetical protein